MPGMEWRAPIGLPAIVAGTALANSTTLTDISNTLAVMSTAANQIVPGSAFHVGASGVFSTTTGPPTLRLGVYYGGVAGVSIADTGDVATTASVTNLQWFLDLLVICRTNGATGTLWAQGTLSLGTSATAMNTIPLPGAAPAAVTVDTTAAKAWTIGGKWGTASASNTVQCHNFLVESLTL